MELHSIAASMEQKSILVTGSTGFLAKIFIEKVLRVQPNVKKLFLLIRAESAISAEERLDDEVIGKDLFRVLREKYGANFNSFIADKVTPIGGDISDKNIGIKDLALREKMWNELDVIVNIAATTKFNERYDVCFNINTMGAKHVLLFAKRCLKLEMFLHVSTAYVCGERAGLNLETPFKMGETLNGMPGLDIEREHKLVQEKMTELQTRKATKEETRIAFMEFGSQRSRLYGWPNAYVFTKSMGEMLLGHLRENVPLCIVRPTIITSTYKEPFPGWVEGVRTIDTLSVGYGQGKLTSFLGGDRDLIIDLIPADMVVNAMITAMVTHANQPKEHIYQVGSSSTNPFPSRTLIDLNYRYFLKNPWTDKHGKPILIKESKLFPTASSFHRYMALHYILPLKVLQAVNVLLCNCIRDTCTNADRKINSVLRLVELYRPYMLFRGIFDISNTKSLGMSLTNRTEYETYYFDPKIIDWEDYILNVHLPGMVRYVFN